MCSVSAPMDLQSNAPLLSENFLSMFSLRGGTLETYALAARFSTSTRVDGEIQHPSTLRLARSSALVSSVHRPAWRDTPSPERAFFRVPIITTPHLVDSALRALRFRDRTVQDQISTPREMIADTSPSEPRVILSMVSDHPRTSGSRCDCSGAVNVETACHLHTTTGFWC